MADTEDLKDQIWSGLKAAGKDLSTPVTLSDPTRGKATKFKSETYRTDNYSYPSDLMTNQRTYGGNYVIFYINVSVDSKLIKSASEADLVPVDDIPPRDRGDLIAMNLSKTKLGAANTVAVVGGAVLAKTVGLGSGTSTTLLAAGTVGTVATANIASSATRAQRRLKTAIAMHVPNQLSIRYGVQYSDDDTAALQMIAAGGSELLNAVKSNNYKNLGGTAQAIVTNLALSKGPGASGMSAATGLAPNPKKEQLFKGVDFRTFTFDYQFFPRDVTEANNVMEIIKQFKYHMHPEFKDAHNFVYIYPSEFDIYYYQNGEENLNLHRHTSCVLQEMNVNYTPNGTFSTFENGMPTQINVSLGFKELALLTKDKVQDGL